MTGRAIATVLLAALAATPALAASKTIEYGTGACSYKLRFDPAKVNETQLRDTLRLLFDAPVPDLFDQPDPARLQKQIAAAEQSCKAKLDEIGRLKLLAVPGVEAARDQLRAETELSCRMSLAELRGFTDPAQLNGFTTEPKCTFYIDALAGRVPKAKALETLSAASCADNASPARCRKEFADRAGDDTKYRLDLLSYGWRNCVLHAPDQPASDGNAARNEIGEKIIARYKIKESCED